MGLKIFESIISERLGDKEEAKKEGLPVFDNAAEKAKLLALLPEELREKSLRENFPLEHLKKIVEYREQKGFKTILGFHVSPREFKVGEGLQAGLDGEVYFSTNLETLYLGKGSGYIYAIECSEKLMKPSDQNMNWYTLKGKITILDKIKMTPEVVEALGVKFAECDYS